jgi:hypothetical protein
MECFVGGEAKMMNRPSVIACVVVLAAIFTPGFLTAASADVVNIDNFAVTRDSTPLFNDSFGANLTLAGGGPPGALLPSGMNFSNTTTPASYLVIGTVTETGSKGILDTALGPALFFGPPFSATAKLNDADLQTGPPTSPFSLTPNDAFATTALFDLTVPQTPGGLYQLELSNRVAENMGNGDVISVQVQNCPSGAPAACGSATAPIIVLKDANFATNTFTFIAQTPLDTSNQQILLELSHPTPGIPDVKGSFAYVNGGVEGPLTTLGDYTGLFQGPGGLNYTQAGFLNIAFTTVPEPSSLTLLAPSIASVLGLVWLRRRNAAVSGSKIETRT